MSKTLKVVLITFGVLIFSCILITLGIGIGFYFNSIKLPIDNINLNRSCTYNGITYKSGDSFKDADDCNTCGCEDGMVACTEMACLNQNDNNSNPGTEDIADNSNTILYEDEYIQFEYPDTLNVTVGDGQTTRAGEIFDGIWEIKYTYGGKSLIVFRLAEGGMGGSLTTWDPNTPLQMLYETTGESATYQLTRTPSSYPISATSNIYSILFYTKTPASCSDGFCNIGNLFILKPDGTYQNANIVESAVFGPIISGSGAEYGLYMDPGTTPILFSANISTKEEAEIAQNAIELLLTTAVRYR
jgi:hypothetical protein